MRYLALACAASNFARFGAPLIRFTSKSYKGVGAFLTLRKLAQIFRKIIDFHRRYQPENGICAGFRKTSDDLRNFFEIEARLA